MKKKLNEGQSIGKKELREALANMRHVATNTASNMAYVVRTAEEAIEKSVAAAKIDIETYSMSTAIRPDTMPDACLEIASVSKSNPIVADYFGKVAALGRHPILAELHAAKRYAFEREAERACQNLAGRGCGAD